MKIMKIKQEGRVSLVADRTVGSMQWCSQNSARRGECEAEEEFGGGIWDLAFKYEIQLQGAYREEQKTVRSIWCA